MTKWYTTRLEDVAQVLGGGTPSRTESRYFGGSIAWATPTDITSLDRIYISKTKETVTEEGLRNSSTKLMPAGAVLLTSRATIGFTAVSTVPICTNQGFINFICGPDLVPEYLAYWLRTQKEKMIQHAGGTTFKEIARGTLRKFEIPVPPLPQQRHIVDLLSRAEGIVRLRREAEKKTAELIPAMFINMFGDPATNPKGWLKATIGDLFEVKGGKRLPKGAPYAEEPTAFRYIRGTDIWHDEINRQNLVYLRPEDQATIKRYVVAKGDVVITIAGKIGVAAPVGDNLAGVNLTENAAMIRPNGTNHTNAAFLSSMLNSRFVQRQIETLTGRVTIGKLALERIRLIEICVPPLDLQAEYVQRVEQIRSIQTQQSTAMAKTHAIFDGLLAQVFSVSEATP